MSMKIDPNPLHWSEDIKALGRLLTLVMTIGGPLVYIGQGLYNFAEAQTQLIQQVRNMQEQLIDEKVQIQDANVQRERAFIGLKDDVVPRIMKLEDAIHGAEREASAAHARAEDMKEMLKKLEDYAAKNLAVTESHNADIKATRQAVDPVSPAWPGR